MRTSYSMSSSSRVIYGDVQNLHYHFRDMLKAESLKAMGWAMESHNFLASLSGERLARPAPKYTFYISYTLIDLQIE